MASAEETDAAVLAALREADVGLIADGVGVDYEDAQKIYELLLATGLPSGIKYVTAWNDADTGEVYYRVRTDTEKREVYLYSDGDEISFRITDGDIDYSVADSAEETEVDVSETEPPKEIDTEDVTAADTETTAEHEETDGMTEVVTETEKVTEAVTEKVTEIVTEEVTETVAETATETAVETAAETEKEKLEITLNTNTKKYHYQGCKSIDQMKEKNKKTVFVSSVDELFDMGYEPCGNCAKKDKR